MSAEPARAIMIGTLPATDEQVRDLREALTRNQVLPSPRDLKRLVNAGRWDEVGRLFQFTPVFLSPGVIDWRCVPKRCYEILQQAKGRPGNRMGWDYGREVPPVRMKAARVKLLPKADDRLGAREWLYCQQSAHCHYCGEWVLFAQWTVEHKQPLGRGGNGDKANKVGCCVNCNAAKGPLTEAEFLATDYMGGPVNLKDAVRAVQKELTTETQS